MSQRPARLQRNRSIMEIESSSQDLPLPELGRRSASQRFDALRVRRGDSKNSESKLSEFMGDGFNHPNQMHCEFCNQRFSMDNYHQHITDCPNRHENFHEDINEFPHENNTAIQEEHDIPDEPDSNNSLQLLRPTRENASQPGPGSLMNSLGNPMRQPSRPEPVEEPLRNPFTFLSSLFGNPSPSTNNTNAQSPLRLPDSPSNQTEQQSPQHQHEGGLGHFPHGAIIVRTVQPGPDGAIIVRMRVIPMDDIFGRPRQNVENGEAGQNGENGENAENGENNDNREPIGLFGALFSMLAGLHGVRAVSLGDLMGLFHEERGLDKEVLDSLPVVKYSSEAFKNVEDESKRCTICLENYEEDNEVKYLWCLHRFHKSCVDQWLDKHTNCPVCKKDYSEAIKKEYTE